MRKIIKHISLYITILLGFFLPLNERVVPILIVLLIVTWLFGNNFKQKFQQFKNNKINFYFLILFISFYLFYVIGLSYSKNLSYGLFDLEIKLSLLIFPILISTSKIDKQYLNKLLMAFVIGCFISGIICLAHSFYKFRITSDINEFYYKNLSVILHPSYFSMFLDFGVCILIYTIINNFRILSALLKILYLTLILFFFTLIIMLSSKAGILTLMLSILIVLVYTIFILKKYIFGTYLFISSTLVLLILFKIFPLSITRMTVAKESFMKKSYDETSTEGTEDRLMIWKTSIDLIKEHFLFGVGTGDVKDILIKKYSEKNITYAAQQKLNTHNQYLQTFLATGVIGFLLLILCLILPAIKAFKEKNILYLLLIFIIGFNMLFESMLERQAGVVFYGLFNSFLFFL